MDLLRALTAPIRAVGRWLWHDPRRARNLIQLLMLGLVVGLLFAAFGDLSDANDCYDEPADANSVSSSTVTVPCG